MPAYVILEHDWPALHWDLLLDVGDRLLAWRLWQEPAVGKSIPAEPNREHRRVYLEYEGPLSGDRGRVLRWDHGNYEAVGADSYRLSGQRLRARIEFRIGDDGCCCIITPV